MLTLISSVLLKPTDGSLKRNITIYPNFSAVTVFVEIEMYFLYCFVYTVAIDNALSKKKNKRLNIT